MTNSEVAKEILKIAEEEHINLYHSVGKEKVYKFFNSFLEKADTMDQLQFDYNMLKLFAMFKDDHTQYSLKDKLSWDHRLWFYDSTLYIIEDGKYYLVDNINDVSATFIANKLAELASYVTEVWKEVQISDFFNYISVYKMLGIIGKDEEIMVNCKDHEPIIVKKFQSKLNTNMQPSPNQEKLKYYYFNVQTESNKNILNIRYKQCKDNPVYPFNDFIKDIILSAKTEHIKGFILDLRSNDGGNDKYIKDLLHELKKFNLPSVVLINAATFSSGPFGAVDAQKALKATLIGQPTGGSYVTYGNGKFFEVQNNKFRVSTAFYDKNTHIEGDLSYPGVKEKGFDGTHLKDYGKPVEPDIYVPITIKDLETKNDTALQTAKDVIVGKYKTFAK